LARRPHFKAGQFTSAARRALSREIVEVVDGRPTIPGSRQIKLYFLEAMMGARDQSAY
jgi:hypothetical protein